MANVTLTINGQQISVVAGTTVLQAAQKLGIDIPTFCYEKYLTAPGACRMCIVEIQGGRNLPAACVTPVAPGMVVETESPAVQEARKVVLELIIANHPLDCMTCEKAGSCKLQDYAYRYGVTGNLFKGEQKQIPLDDSNPYIQRDLNKCILCGKCVATCNAIAERSVIDFAHRGFNTKIATPMDADLKDSTCVYCNRCVTVCPVGALVDKTMLGKGRTWEFRREVVTCKFCESGCQFDLNFKGSQLIGVTAKNATAGRPLCLKGRMGTALAHGVPLTPEPVLKQDGKFISVSWGEALGLQDILDKLQ